MEKPPPKPTLPSDSTSCSYSNVGKNGHQTKLLSSSDFTSTAKESTQSRKAKVQSTIEGKPAKKHLNVVNKSKEVEFKVVHGLFMLFFLWILYLHATGIWLFTRGFLLMRVELGDTSSCEESPLENWDRLGPGLVNSSIPRGNGCWHKKSFNKAVIVVIDALRWDFTVPYTPRGNISEESREKHYHNALTVLSETVEKIPENAILFPFIADPPTTTLQRLKGLTTGTLPTFIDAGSNFAGDEIEEDNLIAQLQKNGKRIAFLGDDTWMALFGKHFEQNMTWPYESLNVWDLHTLDNGVNQHIFPLLEEEEQRTKWDVLIAHYLGVDHAGHRYGPDHPAMHAKLNQMDGVIRRIMETIDEGTIMVVLGDHGMDSKGDHGGESWMELEASLWMYSKRPIFGRLGTTIGEDGRPRNIPQIDLVSTLCLLLGLPIPFNNLGFPIQEAFIGVTGDNWKNLAEVGRITAAQIKRYQNAYTVGRAEDGETFIEAERYWVSGKTKWEAAKEESHTKENDWKDIWQDFSAFQVETLRKCKFLWAEFDIPSMIAGILVLLCSIAVVVVYSRGIVGNRNELTGLLLQNIGAGMSTGVGLAFFSNFLISTGLSRGNTALLGSAIGGILGFAVATFRAKLEVVSPFPNTLWGYMGLVFTLVHSSLFGSNSFIVWEDQIVVFMIASFGVIAFLSSQRIEDKASRALGTYHSVVFLILTRLASLSRLCREEQIPYCKSTFYATDSSSVSSPYSLILLFAVAIALPSVIKSFYQGSKSYEGPAVFWIGFAFRIGLFLNAIFWTLDSADNGQWVSIEESLMKAIKMMIAQIVLALGLIAAHIGFAWAPLCMGIDVREPKKTSTSASELNTSLSENGLTPVKIQSTTCTPILSKKDIPKNPTENSTILLLGYSNLHGSRYLLLPIAWTLALVLLSKPLGGISLSLLLYQILSLVEILEHNNLLSKNAAIGPVMLGLLGHAHYFSTGHQATLQSIQWEIAFLPFKSLVYPWAPLLITLNTLSGPILTAACVPLLSLWKVEPRKKGLLRNVARDAATLVLYHIVVAMGTVLSAAGFRRHLMLFRVFCPRFLLGAVMVLVVEIVVAIVAIGGLRWNFQIVCEIFGWVY